jgi:hypothetical protein
MMPTGSTRALLLGALVALVAAGCGDDAADRLGVGAECAIADDCYQDEQDQIEQQCLTQFKGGYCGVINCVDDADCPGASGCVTHDDGVNYCFRVCVDKIDCNRNRSVDNESNCSSSVDFVEGAQGRKACVPPSSG